MTISQLILLTATRSFRQLLMVVTALTVSALAVSAGASVVHDETLNGDLSNDNNNPTMLIFDVGENSVTGFTDPSDADFFTITIPQNLSITSIILDELTNSPGNRSYFTVGPGNSIDTFDGSGHLGGTLLDVAQVGTDILDDLAQQNPDTILNGTGFTPPLGPGTYTFWYQETGANTTYSFRFHVASSAIPEPGSGLLLSGLGLAALVRRRR